MVGNVSPVRTYPPKRDVPRADYEQLLAACGRSSELLLQLTKRLAFYEREDAVTHAAHAHRRYLQSIGAKA
jgi:hypothetical protein